MPDQIPHLSRRGFLASSGGIVAAAGVSALLGGCSNNSRTASSTSSASTTAGATTTASKADLSAFTSAKINWKQFQGTTITVSAEQHPWYTAMSPLLGEFTELTGIKVTPSVLGEDQYVAKIAVELSGRSSSPDVFMINQFGQATGSGWLEPLDSYLADTSLTDTAWYEPNDFFPGALSFTKSGGKQMAMPITAEAEMLFLRSDLIKTAPKTLDQLVASAKATHTSSVAGFSARPAANANQSPWPFGGFAFSEGGLFLDANGKPVLDSPANVTALTLYSQLLSKYGPKGVSAWGFLENVQAMQLGRVAMWTDSSTFLGELRDPTKTKFASKIDAYPFPSHNGVSKPSVWYWTVGINAKSTNKKAAWLFLQWATSKSVSQAAGAVGASPARSSTWRTPKAAAPIGTANAQRILTALQRADSKPFAQAWTNPKWSQAADGLARAINGAVTGSNPASVLKSAQSQAKSILS